MTEETQATPTAKTLDITEALALVEQGLAKVSAYQEALVLKSARAYIEELRKQIAEKTETPESEPAAEAAE